jgi:hypothetical protein
MYDMKAGGLIKLFSPMIVSPMRKELKKSLVTSKAIFKRRFGNREVTATGLQLVTKSLT